MPRSVNVPADVRSPAAARVMVRSVDGVGTRLLSPPLLVTTVVVPPAPTSDVGSWYTRWTVTEAGTGTSPSSLFLADTVTWIEPPARGNDACTTRVRSVSLAPGGTFRPRRITGKCSSVVDPGSFLRTVRS